MSLPVVSAEPFESSESELLMAGEDREAFLLKSSSEDECCSLRATVSSLKARPFRRFFREAVGVRGVELLMGGGVLALLGFEFVRSKASSALRGDIGGLRSGVLGVAIFLGDVIVGGETLREAVFLAK